MDDLIVLLKVLDLLHDLFENFGAVLWRIAVFYKADLDLQLQLIADVLIVQPVSKRRFGVDNFFDLLRQSLALVVDDSTINLFIGSVFKIIPVPQGKENKAAVSKRLLRSPAWKHPRKCPEEAGGPQL